MPLEPLADRRLRVAIAPAAISQASERQPIPPANRIPPQRANEQVQRRRNRRAGQPRRASAPVDDVDREPRLQVDMRFGANPAQESKRLAIRAGQHVLAVVHALTGRGIDEGRRATAKRRARLEHENANALLGQSRGRTQPGKAAADDDDFVKSIRSKTSPSVRCLHSDFCILHSEQRLDPQSQRDDRALRPRHADAFAEHIVTVALDASQDLEVDAAHDLGRHEAARVLRRQLFRSATIVAARPLALELQQLHDRRGQAAGSKVVLGDTESSQILGGQIDRVRDRCQR